MEQTRIDAGGLSFDAWLDGPPSAALLLLLHGFPQTSHSWHKLMPGLAAAGFRVLAPDLRGVSPGARPLEPSAYAIEFLVGDVLALADAAGADTFHLAGHDWGGALAWQVAGRHAQRLRSLTVVSTPHPTAFRRALDDPSSDQRQRSSYFETFRTPGAGEDMWLAGGREGLRDMYRAAGLSDEEMAPCLETFSDRSVLTAFLNWYRAADPASDVGMRPITTPTLYAWSSGDPALGPEAAAWTADCVKADYQFEVFEGIDHWIPEHAVERLLSSMIHHLRANS